MKPKVTRRATLTGGFGAGLVTLGGRRPLGGRPDPLADRHRLELRFAADRPTLIRATATHIDPLPGTNSDSVTTEFGV